jgi:hypothetical protein
MVYWSTGGAGWLLGEQFFTLPTVKKLVGLVIKS